MPLARRPASNPGLRAALVARRAIHAAKVELRAGRPLAEVIEREDVRRHARLADLVLAVPKVGEHRRDVLFRAAERELGDHRNRLFVERVGDLTQLELNAVLRML